MYQSLYRTWRPRTFSEMVGQENVVRTLKNQVATGHIAHAYLFSGSRGTGKTSAARILSMAINCLNPVEGDPCLHCSACESLQNESTLDVFEMDAASNSRVEEIREMLEKVSYPPQFVKSKVYIIDEVHMLSNAAFNALLKTLEEPPGYMVFILATTEPQKLPATILSRCQRFDFGRIAEEAMLNRLKLALKPGQQAEEGALQLIATAAEGSMRDAWSLMDMCLSGDSDLTEASVREALGAVDRAFMFDFVDAVAARDAAAAFLLIERLMQSGKDIQVFLKDLSGQLRRLIAARLDQASVRELSPQYRQRLLKQAGEIPLASLVHMMDRAVQAEGSLRWASQQRSVLEVFALSLCLPEAGEDPLALQARLAELEKAVPSPAPGKAQPSQAEQPKIAPKPAPPPESESSEPVAEAVIAPAPVQTVESKPEAKAELSLLPETSPDAPPAPIPVRVLPLAGQPAPSSDHNQHWNSMLERLKREQPSIYGMLSAGKYGGYRDKAFRLNFDQAHSFFANYLMDDERRQIIEGLLSEQAGEPMRLECGSEKDVAVEQDHRQKALQDVKALSDMFGRQNVIVTGAEDLGPL